MVISCSAIGCTNRQGEPGISFYRFPSDPKRRAAWVAACRRKDWIPSSTARLCSTHFVNGKVNDPLSPDFVPTLFSFTPSPLKRKKIEDTENFERRKKTTEKRFQQAQLAASTKQVPQTDAEKVTEDEVVPQTDAEKVTEDEVGDDEQPEIKRLSLENEALHEKIAGFKGLICDVQMTQDGFRENDKKVSELIGLPNYEILMFVVDTIAPFLLKRQEVTAFQQVIMTCMLLRNSCSGYLASYLFHVHRSTVSRIFNDVLLVICRRLVPATVFWPQREDLRMSLPVSFRESFKNCACVIDCFEVKIERATGLKVRAQTYSQYKANNTIKYLIAITPQGAISFVSKGWGGRTSDKHITLNSGFLNNLLPGDLVLADRGFNIEASVGMMNAILKIPAFTKGKKQLDPLDVESSRKLSSQRIHVERVIGTVRQKYPILNQIVPILYLNCDSYGCTTLDRIVQVACAFVNLCEPIVPFE